jgi:hypothetical protein
MTAGERKKEKEREREIIILGEGITRTGRVFQIIRLKKKTVEMVRCLDDQ